eukprot:gene22707-29864_t
MAVKAAGALGSGASITMRCSSHGGGGEGGGAHGGGEENQPRTPPTPCTLTSGAKALANTKLQKLQLKHAAMSKAYAASIICKVMSLELSESTLGQNGAKIIAELLDCGLQLKHAAISKAYAASSICNVTSLDLSENPLGLNGAKIIADLLDCGVTRTQFLTVLKLNKCGIPDLGGVAICAGLNNGNQTLTVLHMSNNQLGNKAAQSLGELLKNGITKLSDVDLGWNAIKVEGARSLFSGLENNESLTSLDLGWNGVETEGGKYVGKMLAKNSTLLKLDLTNTRLGSDAALMISEGVKVNTVIQELNLNGNAFGDDGARYLMGALKANTSLKFLGLQHHGSRVPTSIKCVYPYCGYVGVTWGIAQVDQEQLLYYCVIVCVTLVAGVPGNFFYYEVIEQKKLLALGDQLESRSMGDKERLALLEVMAPFNYFYCHQIAQLLGTFSMGDECVNAAAMLFTRAADLEENMDLLFGAIKRRDMFELQTTLRWFLSCRFANFVGHYELNLSQAIDRHLARRLMDEAQSEAVDRNNWINLEHDLYTSTTKFTSVDRNNWINLEHDLYTSTTKVPKLGMLCVDCVSSKVPPAGEEALDEETFREFMEHGIGNQIWTIMYSLRPMEQAVAMWRLGPNNLYDKHHPSGHYILDVTNPAHETIGKRLMDLAANFQDFPNIWNIRSTGTKKQLTENRNMWGSLASESSTPFLEFDFLGQDVWDCVLGKTKAEMDPIGKGDRLEMVAKYARRLELARIKDMYAYYDDGSSWVRPPWQSFKQLFGLMLKKSPWAAAYDRGIFKQLFGLMLKKIPWAAAYDRLVAGQVGSLILYLDTNRDHGSLSCIQYRVMRRLVRIEARASDMQGDSLLEDIFDEYCDDDCKLIWPSFETALRSWGYTRGEIFYHYRCLFDALTIPTTPAPINEVLPSLRMAQCPRPRPYRAVGEESGIPLFITGSHCITDNH